MQKDGRTGIAEGFLHQPHIAGAVFHQENSDGSKLFSAGFHDFLTIARRESEACLNAW
jgi:hypothetical protein